MSSVQAVVAITCPGSGRITQKLPEGPVAAVSVPGDIRTETVALRQ